MPSESNNPWDQLKDSIDDARDWSTRTIDLANRKFNEYSDRVQTDGWYSLPGADLLNSVMSENPLVASRVPSLYRYSQCKENNGVSAWTREGIWKCLMPSKDEIDFSDNKLFRDYTGYLDFKLSMYKAQQAQLENDRRKRHQSVMWRTPKFISEEEAQGKNAVGERSFTQTITDETGHTETKRTLYKYFDDGTAFKKEETSAGGKGSWFW
ncbi:Mitochondrial peculiar membrane protein 1 [Wickerhamiella sorbophila]|uniref:Mitochondrial peculiar membrane protein 1 n=1 Tax=Wickerhamiella sorbophila TaxID=45607 RepID=A0A2T0FFF7_9ASCO|nr:Mitochondrial peculiar membrane protein 1 [Wickerhamiella sorbophila]PRT53731.1 Mitochondrial peculiar membrane protein 1 [Wickerhamiella sorbophila]